MLPSICSKSKGTDSEGAASDSEELDDIPTSEESGRSFAGLRELSLGRVKKLSIFSIFVESV